jgi:serine/threonine-protein kinase ATR
MPHHALPALSLVFLTAALIAAEPTAAKPAFRDFMGICGHTIQFKPELYSKVCRLVRDYHPVHWDLGDDTAFATTFPFARNRVDWSRVYGSWRKHGFDNLASLMFESIKQEHWKDVPRDAFAYGQAFARHFGPSHHRLMDAVEIGNEPGKWKDADYRVMFESMAKGLRAGDPQLRIATCAADAGKGDDYSKALTCVQGLENLYDIITVHSYAQLENWPTWKRGCPEDPQLIDYLPRIEQIIAWRDAHAPGKQIWLTEFGYDSTTKPQQKTGTFKQWVGVTDTQQAQWLVRSFLVFSSMAMDRAYLYFFDDKDEPTLHACAGLTRNFQPKPSFHAVAHLYRTLGDHRFARVVERRADRWVFEYQQVDDARKRIWAVWSPTATDRDTRITLTGLPGTVVKAERMPLTAEAVTNAGDSTTVTVNGSPLYVWMVLP